LLMLQPAKVARPDTALMGFAVQVRAAVPAGGVMLRETGTKLMLTGSPPAS